MRKVLVTGASGFIGGHIVQTLRSQGLPVRCLVRPTSRLDFIKPFDPELAWGDVMEPETLGPAIAGADAVVHCAGVTKARSRSEYFRINESGTRNLFAAFLKRKGEISKIVHVSSLAAFGPSADGNPVTEDTPPHPVGDYGASKLAAQRLAESHMDDLPVSIVVPPAVYGPRDPDFHVYFRFVARGFLPLLGREARHLSLIYAKDLAAAVAAVLTDERATGRAYLVEDGNVQTWTSIGQAIGSAMNRQPHSIHLPIVLVKGMAAVGDFTSKLTGKAWLLNSQKVREFTAQAWICSSRRIRDELGFCPQYPLARGIQETLAWYRENRWL
jgi:nucleoside-diphosphate-sugar epimerase